MGREIGILLIIFYINYINVEGFDIECYQAVIFMYF